MNDVKEKYFEWLYDKVINVKMRNIFSYGKLLRFLHSVNFTYIIPRDENRYADGIELRYRFGREKGFDDRIIASELDVFPCSVLEMMVALSLRIEEQIMVKIDAGDRTFKWFWEMLANLGLAQMQDDSFDFDRCERVCERFLNREYEPNGEGGLFRIYHRQNDMRNVEIWYQAMWYLSELDDV